MTGQPGGPMSRPEILTALDAAGIPAACARHTLARAFAQPYLPVPVRWHDGEAEVTWRPGSRAPGGDFTIDLAISPAPAQDEVQILDLDRSLRTLMGGKIPGLPGSTIAALRQLHRTLGRALEEAPRSLDPVNGFSLLREALDAEFSGEPGTDRLRPARERAAAWPLTDGQLTGEPPGWVARQREERAQMERRHLTELAELDAGDGSHG